jgi:hypothetical protein
VSEPTFLTGPRVRLRALSAADVDGPYLTWFNDGEVSRLNFHHVFGALNLHRIGCGTVAANVGMCRIAERLGMTQEGVRRQAVWTDGAYHDVIEFGLLAEEFDR